MRGVDVGLLTVKLPERRAAFGVLGLSSDASPTPIERKDHWFAEIVSEKLERSLTVGLTMFGEQGNEVAGLETERFIRRLKPSLLFLVGIAAGLEEKVDLYDVVASTEIYGYEPARAEPGRLRPRPSHHKPPLAIREDLTQFDPEALREAQPDLPIKPGRVHKGIIASGEKLIADGRLLPGLREHEEGIRAAEMEGAGFGRACETASYPVQWLVIRGVSDWGDAEKSRPHEEQSQERAATAALRFWHAFVARAVSRHTLDAGSCDRQSRPSATTARHRGSVSHSMRTSVLELLTGEAPMTVSEIARRLGVSEKIVADTVAGLVQEGHRLSSDSDGRWSDHGEGRR